MKITITIIPSFFFSTLCFLASQNDVLLLVNSLQLPPVNRNTDRHWNMMNLSKKKKKKEEQHTNPTRNKLKDDKDSDAVSPPDILYIDIPPKKINNDDNKNQQHQHELEDLLIHEQLMGLALEEAKKAGELGEVPIGAIIVKENTVLDESSSITSNEKEECTTRTRRREFEIISRGQNQIETFNDASAHAEMQSLRAASKAIQNWRLLNTTLYSTLEPCPMCLSAAQAFRVSRVVYGAPDLRLGAIDTHINLLEIAKHPFHDEMEVLSGVRGEECGQLLVEFFRRRRKASKEEKKKRQKLNNMDVVGDSVKTPVKIKGQTTKRQKLNNSIDAVGDTVKTPIEIKGQTTKKQKLNNSMDAVGDIVKTPIEVKSEVDSFVIKDEPKEQTTKRQTLNNSMDAVGDTVKTPIEVKSEVDSFVVKDEPKEQTTKKQTLNNSMDAVGDTAKDPIEVKSEVDSLVIKDEPKEQTTKKQKLNNSMDAVGDTAKDPMESKGEVDSLIIKEEAKEQTQTISRSSRLFRKLTPTDIKSEVLSLLIKKQAKEQAISRSSRILAIFKNGVKKIRKLFSRR